MSKLKHSTQIKAIMLFMFAMFFVPTMIMWGDAVAQISSDILDVLSFHKDGVGWGLVFGFCFFLAPRHSLFIVPVLFLFLDSHIFVEGIKIGTVLALPFYIIYFFLMKEHWEAKGDEGEREREREWKEEQRSADLERELERRREEQSRAHLERELERRREEQSRAHLERKWELERRREEQRRANLEREWELERRREEQSRADLERKWEWENNKEIHQNKEAQWKKNWEANR